ncbi:unnamed protein product [Ilex paraguariensis]|uniref:NADP-dependent oxidoreductase domain-containing protein n=1 Tax=Ilex paraguariensis TaxID=185542 RepID=A0ABC8SM25_9AQUA
MALVILSLDGIRCRALLLIPLPLVVRLASSSFGKLLIRIELLTDLSCLDLTLPRFQPENVEHNKKLYEQVNAIATRKGCITSQLALAWLQHQGNDVSPIPSTTKIENFNQNVGALSVKLAPEEITELESIATVDAVKGDRYEHMATTWRFANTPPLSS